MDIRKIKLLFNTVKYLKFIQVYYRGYYFFKNRFFKKEYNKKISSSIQPIKWKNFIVNSQSYSEEKQNFNFLNITQSFPNKIDWNYPNYGKLWTYNLNYFDFLNQKDLSKEIGLALIHDYLENDAVLKEGKESYPISLRGINWIKFLSSNKVEEEKINQTFYNHYQILLNNLEYHLLGNHLLENGFSLLFGAYYFQDEKLYVKARKILFSELKEQILADGAHFELSPMYHQIMLYRILDCVNLIQLNFWKNDVLIEFLKDKADLMLSWLQAMTFKNGAIPMFNDSTFNIVPSSKKIFNYAKKNGLKWNTANLTESGYRKYYNDSFELIIDLGSIKANYQPAHTHADTFTFCLNCNGNPIIVDPGISTYNIGERRNTERSTIMHNTVSYDSKNSSEVWSGFRVAKRAKIVEIEETKNAINAIHNGYKKYGIQHNRKLNFDSKKVKVIDKLIGKINYKSISSLHFHPDVKLSLKENVLFVNNDLKISFKGFEKIKIINFDYAEGFNKLKTSKKTQGFFKEESQFIIERTDN